MSRVSAVIPARNEERNIDRAVRSLAVQEGIREIIVVDDQSGDRTGEIVKTLQREIGDLCLLHIDSLPDGWLGKTHAAAVGARAAAGEWLLFTDADTEHLPGSLACLVARAERERVDLLSLSPGQVMVMWWEKAVIPFVYAQLAKEFHFEEVSDPDSSAAAANGQYILIRKQAYARVGGHEAVRREVLEDVALAQRVKASGGRLLFLPGGAWVRTRMYASFSEMWQGWTKNLALLYQNSGARILAVLGEIMGLDLIPLAVFLACVFLVAAGDTRGVVVWLGVVALLTAWWRIECYALDLTGLGFERRLAYYRSLGALLFSLLLLNSLLAHRVCKAVKWKGRTYRTRGDA